MLGSDRGRPDLPGPAARPEALVPARRVGLEPVRALPARLLPERRAELLEPRVGRREPERPAGEPLLARVLDVVVGRIDLVRARERVVAAAVMRAEAARVHLPDVEARDSLDDPLGDEPTHPARAGEAVRAEAGRDPEAAHVGLAEDELAVGSERLGPVDEADDLGFLEVGDANARVGHELVEALPVLGQQLAVEVLRDAVEPPRRGVPLVAAHDEAARLAAEVDEERRVAHRRDVERDPARPRDEVLVSHRDDRHGHAREAPDLAREHASRVDHDSGLDRALVRFDADHAAALEPDPGHPRVRVDLGASPPRALGEGKRQLTRVDVAVGRKVGRAEHAVRGHRREELGRPLGGDELEREPEGLRPAGLAAKLLHPLLRRGEPEGADLAPAGLEADLLLERPVEVDRVHHHLGQADGAAQLPDQAGGMEGRAAGQVRTLAKDDVVPAEPGEPVQDRGAADPSADDDGART